jgi:hypothetical protein
MFLNLFAKRVWLIGCIIPAILLFIVAPCFSESMKDTANLYFTALKKDFDKLAKNPVLKNPATSPVNRLFVASLKKHQPTASLVRVNAKGIIINEVMRGKVSLKKVNKKVGSQKWYSAVAKTKKVYNAVMEENGRYYVLWCKPVVSKKKRLIAVVAAKIDMGDCFDLLSRETTAPYLVRMEEKILYSHKWKNDSSYLEEPMTIPGIEKITFLTEKPVAASHAAETLDVSVQRVNAVPAAPTQVTPEKPVKAKQAPVKITKKRVFVIIIGIVVVLLLIIFLFRFYIWLNHKFLMHSINKSD